MFIFTQGSPLGGVRRTTLLFLVHYKAAKKKNLLFLYIFVLLLCLMDFTDHKSLGTNGMHNYASCSLFFFFFFSLNRDKNLSVEAFQGCTLLTYSTMPRGLIAFQNSQKKSQNSGWAESPFSQNNMVHFHMKTDSRGFLLQVHQDLNIIISDLLFRFRLETDGVIHIQILDAVKCGK